MPGIWNWCKGAIIVPNPLPNSGEQQVRNSMTWTSSFGKVGFGGRGRDLEKYSKEAISLVAIWLCSTFLLVPLLDSCTGHQHAGLRCWKQVPTCFFLHSMLASDWHWPYGKGVLYWKAKRNKIKIPGGKNWWSRVCKMCALYVMPQLYVHIWLSPL